MEVAPTAAEDKNKPDEKKRSQVIDLTGEAEAEVATATFVSGFEEGAVNSAHKSAASSVSSLSNNGAIKPTGEAHHSFEELEELEYQQRQRRGGTK